MVELPSTASGRRRDSTPGKVSETATMTVRIDTAAPTAAASVTGTGALRQVTLSGKDSRSGIAGISYRIDNGPMLGYTGAFSVPAGAKVTYAALDRAGNASLERVLTTR